MCQGCNSTQFPKEIPHSSPRKPHLTALLFAAAGCKESTVCIPLQSHASRPSNPPNHLWIQGLAPPYGRNLTSLFLLPDTDPLSSGAWPPLPYSVRALGQFLAISLQQKCGSMPLSLLSQNYSDLWTLLGNFKRLAMLWACKLQNSNLVCVCVCFRDSPVNLLHLGKERTVLVGLRNNNVLRSHKNATLPSSWALHQTSKG